MKRIIILSERDIQDIMSGKEIEVSLNNGEKLYIMDDITYEQMRASDEKNGQA